MKGFWKPNRKRRKLNLRRALPIFRKLTAVPRPSVVVLSCLVLFISVFVTGSKADNDEVRVPITERIRIWDSIAGKNSYAISANEKEAVFESGGAKWTIMGANAPIVSPTTYPKEWPVEGNRVEILTVINPISDYQILPFAEHIDNTVRSSSVEITGACDSYESASLVIRTGDTDLRGVNIETTDLISQVIDSDGNKKEVVFPRDDLDIRVVKCWYQAGVKHNDVKHKRLVPELLLHDDDLVRVDYDNQVNIIRNFDRLEDATRLRPFSISKRQNKQLWLTFHFGKTTIAGKYAGEINITAGNKNIAKLDLVVRVLPFVLPAPMLDYAVYYLGYLSDKQHPVVSTDLKTEDQMFLELTDMKEHGLTNATLYHQYARNEVLDQYLSSRKLEKTLAIRERMGWGSKPLLYLDWTNVFHEDLRTYRRKIERIIQIARSFRITDVYIYGVDEKTGHELRALRPMYQAVHAAGAKSFVACMDDFHPSMSDLIDLPVLHGTANRSFMSDYKRIRNDIWAYSNVGGEVEMPDTYRRAYGTDLLKEGFSGACIFAYQAFFWNDFIHNEYRAHTLAYPTVRRPIPTLQWEGLRAGIEDIRYLTLLKERGKLDENWLRNQCFGDAANCRYNATRTMSSLSYYPH